MRPESWLHLDEDFVRRPTDSQVWRHVALCCLPVVLLVAWFVAGPR